MGRTLTHLELVDQLHSIGSDLYPAELYKGNNTQITWVCKHNPEHRSVALPKTVKKGRGSICKHCSGTYQHTWSYKDIIQAFLKTDILNKATLLNKPTRVTDKAKWMCNKDNSHIWEAKVEKTLIGQGCPYCAPQAKKTEQFYIDWFSLHLPGYRPLKCPTSIYNKIPIKCPKGHIFEQAYDNLHKYRQKYCPECFNQERMERLLSRSEVFDLVGDFSSIAEYTTWECKAKGHIVTATARNVLYQRMECKECAGPSYTDKEILYVLYFKNLGAYKVGITRDLKTLVNRIKYIGIDNCKVMLKLRVDRPLVLEQIILNKLKRYRYVEPLAKSGGTEFLKARPHILPEIFREIHLYFSKSET